MKTLFVMSMTSLALMASAAAAGAAIGKAGSSPVALGPPVATPQSATAKGFTDAAALRYADCLVRHDSKNVRRAIDAERGAPFEAAVSRITVGKCLPGDTTAFATDALRGPLFVAMYKKFGPKAGRTAAAATGWTPKLPAGSELAGWFMVSSCLIRTAPVEVRALILAPPATSEDSAAMAAVTSQLTNCLPGGQKFTINRAQLFGVLAENLYRVQVAPVPGLQTFWGSNSSHLRPEMVPMMEAAI